MQPIVTLLILGLLLLAIVAPFSLLAPMMLVLVALVAVWFVSTLVRTLTGSHDRS